MAAWRGRAGEHDQQIHEAIVEQEHLDLVPVHADEIRVNGRQTVAWMGLVGTVRLSREKELADALLQHVRRTALLVLTDGWAASPASMLRACRENVTTAPGPGRACVKGWPDVHSGTVITRFFSVRVMEITHRMAQGCVHHAEQVLSRSRGGNDLHTACLERLHGTVRERLATLTRSSRHAASRVHALQTGMSLIGCPSTFCVMHYECSTATHWGKACPPAIASGLTDHRWSVAELLRDTIAPAPWVAPQRRGPRLQQATRHTRSDQVRRRSVRVHPVLRLRTGVGSPTTGS